MTSPGPDVHPRQIDAYARDAFAQGAERSLARHLQAIRAAIPDRDADGAVDAAAVLAATTPGWRLVAEARYDLVGQVYRRGDQWLILKVSPLLVRSLLTQPRDWTPEQTATTLLQQISALRTDSVPRALRHIAKPGFGSFATRIAHDLAHGLLASLPEAEAAAHRTLLALGGYGTGLTEAEEPPF